MSKSRLISSNILMNDGFPKKAWMAALIAAVLPLANAVAAGVMNKTLRVEHGRPVVLVSQDSVLLLEFAKESAAEALVPHDDPGTRHCRARYRYQFYDGKAGALTNGQGMVEEIYRTVRTSPSGRQVEDIGSRVGISAGNFYLWWSEGGAGARSWLYYRTDSPIRFIQQPQQVSFDSIDQDQLRRYLGSRNVQEFVAVGRTIRVIGPAVFAGDLPTETPASARVASGRVREGAFELKLTNLATNKHYIIESSLEMKTGSWTPVHSFIARGSDGEWADPLGKDVDVAFYRIREGAY